MAPPRVSLNNLVTEDRARRLMARPFKYVHHTSFDAPDENAIIEWLLPIPRYDEYAAKKRKMKAPTDTPAQLVSHYLWPLLDKDQEQHLFRQMNYLKHLIYCLRGKITEGDHSVIDEAVALQARTDAVRSWLFSCNQRLVVKIATKFAGKMGREFWEVMADGDVSLLNAVEMFDFSFGFKFSTYAYWALMKNYARMLPTCPRNRRPPVISLEDVKTVDLHDEGDAIDNFERREADEHNHDMLTVLLGHLEPRERTILQLRSGIGTDRFPLTLEEVGLRLGITKERVRQVEHFVRKKLVVVAKNVGLCEY